MKGEIIIFRGAGDIATGSIQKLHRAGFRVIACEIEKPTSIRRYVSLSEAVFDGETTVEDVTAKKCSDKNEVEKAWAEDKVAVIVDPELAVIQEIKPDIIVDGILAKKNLGTTKDMAPITIAIGPGFTAGVDVDIVVETKRGHDLGRLIFEGEPAPNSGAPGAIDGHTTDRVLYAPVEGKVKVLKDLGSVVEKGEVLAIVEGEEIRAKIPGIVRGMIRDGSYVTKGFKTGDVDPRVNPEFVYTISDKARAVGGGTLEAVMIMLRKKNMDI
ncbi:selenium-dependent molybdenum cofactor biosynthesis protein YqeB [Gallicola sp. Sow4_E12]|uniref:selenium-dependent molybdenum cofactor biosynthesis protein YqeB n=1 Tax=Gallicola sp. Sow4_E12 TaxID=3438785 RepID=UPI003F933B58